jgi:ADP-ribosylglycohydrolase
MKGRSPGNSCKKAIEQLYEDGSNWDSLPFDKNSGGCGASMRSACIGLIFYKDD